MDIYEILKKPLITEKATAMNTKDNKVCFEVVRTANKHQIKKAVENIFNVKVKDVKTQCVPSDRRRWGRYVKKEKPYKKAIVTLKEGKIEFFKA